MVVVVVVLDGELANPDETKQHRKDFGVGVCIEAGKRDARPRRRNFFFLLSIHFEFTYI